MEQTKATGWINIEEFDKRAREREKNAKPPKRYLDVKSARKIIEAAIRECT